MTDEPRAQIVRRSVGQANPDTHFVYKHITSIRMSSTLLVVQFKPTLLWDVLVSISFVRGP